MPPETRITALLVSARRRAFAIECARALAIACALGAGWLLLRARQQAGVTELIVTALAIIASATAIAAIRSARRSPAAIIESRTDSFHNALVTASQLIGGDLRVKPDIRELVLRDTAARADGVDVREILPTRVSGGLAALALLTLGAALAIGVIRPEAISPHRARLGGMSDGPMSIDRIEITVTPPPYSGRAAARVDNPERIDAIEGSRVALRVVANDQVEHVLLDTGGKPAPLVRDRNGSFTGELVANSQTFLALTPANIAPGERIVIPIGVTPDRAPAVRVTEPGRDLFLANASRDIPVRVAADDDFGVTSLILAYTKVSGSGETFEFVEGTLPLSIARTGERALAGSATIRPSALGLTTGDTLVYRAVARDAHPSRGAVESDAFVIEIVSPSEALAEGFSIDDQRDTYALSQQMVILKTERLMAARRSMAPEAIAEEAARIAAEQRQVRAEFVFMMGGEVEDEEVEAEQSHELAEGLEQREGRRDLIAAIRAMSNAAALLVRPDLEQALLAEKRALASLQRALTRSRYILRVLARRERIEESRRLSGDRTGAGGWRRETGAAASDGHARVLMTAVGQLSLYARKERYADEDRRAITTIATSLLALGDARLQPAAQSLTTAARTRDARAVASLVDAAALAIDAALESRAAGVSVPPPDASDRARAALASGLRGTRPAGGGQ